MSLPPELELLEYLCGEDTPLCLAGRLFPSIDRAKRVVDIYVRSHAAILLCKTNDEGRIVQVWELRELLADPSIWSTPSKTSRIGPFTFETTESTDGGK